MRHGEAERFASGGDSLRELTPFGRDSIQTVSLQLLQSIPDIVDLEFSVGSSGYTRAQDTRSIVESILRPQSRRCSSIPDIEQLSPEASSEDLLPILSSLCETHANLWLVTHQPLISRLMSWLLYGSWEFQADTAIMQPGSACLLEAEVHGQGCYSLRAERHPSPMQANP